jgi:hypothetical protein
MTTHIGRTDQRSTALFSVPHHRGRLIRAAARCSTIAFVFVVGILQLQAVLEVASARRTYAEIAILLLFGFVATLCFFVAVRKTFALRRLFTSPLEIFTDGLQLPLGKLPWEKVAGCRWGRYDSGILEIRTHNRRKPLCVKIDPEYAQSIEAAIRRFDKWEGDAS